MSSTKSMHGHALGASGALELVAVVGALRDSVVPPTANLDQVDPACAILRRRDLGSDVYQAIKDSARS